MTTWRDIDWAQTLGGNDRFGDCVFVSLANLVDLLNAPQVVMEAEIERMYSVETGWSAANPASDKGAVLETVIKDWCENGWPADPELKPSGYRPVALDGLRDALTRCQGAPSWIMLPMTADGTGYDFSDDAVTRDAPGVGAHAVLVVQADDFGIVFITWGKPQGVSWDWAREYWRGSFEVEWVTASG